MNGLPGGGLIALLWSSNKTAVGETSIGQACGQTIARHFF